jgi:ubiquinone/menaquinone biosynthesis C-methylase UbiE
MSFENPTRVERFLEEPYNYHRFKYYFRDQVRRLALEGRETALDMGCGGGAATRHLAAALPDGRVIALDTSKYYLDKAKGRLGAHPNVEFVQEDVRRAAIPDGSVDLVFVHWVLHDVPAPDQGPTVRALAAKLRPGGRLYILEPVKATHGMPSDEILRLMDAAGLRMVDSHRSKKHTFSATFVKDPEGAEVPELEEDPDDLTVDVVG